MTEEVVGVQRKPFFDEKMCKCGFRAHPCYGDRCEDCYVNANSRGTVPNSSIGETVYTSTANGKSGFGLIASRGKRIY